MSGSPIANICAATESVKNMRRKESKGRVDEEGDQERILGKQRSACSDDPSLTICTHVLQLPGTSLVGCCVSGIKLQQQKTVKLTEREAPPFICTRVVCNSKSDLLGDSPKKKIKTSNQETSTLFSLITDVAPKGVKTHTKRLLPLKRLAISIKY